MKHKELQEMENFYDLGERKAIPTMTHNSDVIKQKKNSVTNSKDNKILEI